MRTVAILIACSFVLGGCSLDTLAGLSGGRTGGAPGQAGDPNLDPVLSSYTQTFASGSNTLDGELEGGLEGLAAGPALPTSALAGSFKTAVVTVAGDKRTMIITADGQTFVLKNPYGNHMSGLVTINGQDYKIYGYNQSGVDQEPQEENFSTHYQGRYSSIDVFLSKFDPTGPRFTDGFLMVATGLTTPVASMPRQVVVYDGKWFSMVPSRYVEAWDFTATADFATRQMTYTTQAGTTAAGSGTATIIGNQFKGTYTGAGFAGSTAEVVGTFYGPNAEEVAGVLQGTLNNEVLGGAFFGHARP